MAEKVLVTTRVFSEALQSSSGLSVNDVYPSVCRSGHLIVNVLCHFNFLDSPYQPNRIVILRQMYDDRIEDVITTSLHSSVTVECSYSLKHLK